MSRLDVFFGALVGSGKRVETVATGGYFLFSIRVWKPFPNWGPILRFGCLAFGGCQLRFLVDVLFFGGVLRPPNMAHGGSF